MKPHTKLALEEAARAAYKDGHIKLGLFLEDVIGDKAAFVVESATQAAVLNIPPEIQYDITITNPKYLD